MELPPLQRNTLLFGAFLLFGAKGWIAADSDEEAGCSFIECKLHCDCSTCAQRRYPPHPWRTGEAARLILLAASLGNGHIHGIVKIHCGRWCRTAASYAWVVVIAVMLWVSRVCWRVARRACLLWAENLKKTPGSPHNLVTVPTVECSLQPTHNMLPLVVVTEQMSTPYIGQQKSKHIQFFVLVPLPNYHTQLYNTLPRRKMMARMIRDNAINNHL